MDKVVVTDEVRAFLRNYVESHEQLAVLLFLRAHADRPHTPEAVADTLGLPLDTVADAFGHLHREGLLDVLSRDGVLAFGYQPIRPRLGELVEALARVSETAQAEIAAHGRVRHGARADGGDRGRRHDAHGRSAESVARLIPERGRVELGLRRR